MRWDPDSSPRDLCSASGLSWWESGRTGLLLVASRGVHGWAPPPLAPRSGRRGADAVADAGLGEKVGGVPGVVAQLLAQVLDERAHALRAAPAACAPYPLQDLVVGSGMPLEERSNSAPQSF